MNTIEPREELHDVVCENMDSDEDPEEDPKEEYEEYYEEVSEEEEMEEDPEEDLEEEESNTELNEETGSADKHLENTEKEFPKSVDEIASKKRHSRWDIQTDQNEASGEGEKGKKIRKSRWSSNVTPLKTDDAPIQLPESMNNFVDSELFRKLKQKVLYINREIVKLEAHHVNLTIQESRHKQKEKLVMKRENILKELRILSAKMLDEDPKRKYKFFKKVYIPVKEYSSYNFIGLIIGPRGNTQKKMEVETGASIKIRGKGSTVKERKLDPSDDDDLHVYIEAHDKKSLNDAVAMVEKILIPVDDGNNDFKRAQLRELAEINGTFNTCNACNEPGHKSFACPNRESTFEKVTTCTKCGSFSHPISKCTVKIAKSREINGANLFIGYIPRNFDENKLKELFCPFGKIDHVKVIIDINTGLSKGYGFINFENSTDAAMAITHMNGYKIDGKTLAVRVAGLPPPQPKLPILNPTPRPMGSWMGPPGPILGLIPPPQPGFPALNPFPPYPRPVSISPNILSQTGPHAYLPSSYVYTNQGLNSSSDLSKFPGDPDYRGLTLQFPGDPDYRSSSSLFPGDPDYRSSGTSLFSSDFDFSK